MRTEIVSDDLITVFINNFYFKEINFSKKIEIISIIKDLISKIDKRYQLNLNGFYKIKVYPNQKLGVFLDIIKIDDNEFSSGADFRIVIYQEAKFFLETDNYEILDKKVDKRIYKNKFYIDIDDISDFNLLSDFCNIVYGDNAQELIYNGKIIK